MNQAQRRQIVINDLNINTNILMKHQMLLHNSSLWHKLYVNNCENIDKKVLLKIIMDELYPHDFIPVNFVSDGNSSSFIIKNCAGAIKQICQKNLIVRNPITPERPFKFSVILGFASTQEIRVNMEDKISAVIKKRFNSETKILNLDAFYKDPDLEEFCPLSQPKIMLFVLHMCKSYPFLTLKLSNNEIRSLDALDALISLKVSFALDLRNNLIEKEEDLKVLNSLLISEITLDGNKICQKLNETAYVKMIKNICVDVKKIDGISVSNGFLPHRRNYLCNAEGKDLIDQFLEHYFMLYDTTNRNYLESLYHPKALFTLTSHYISGQQSSVNIRLMSYKKYSRNIKFMSNMSKCDEFVFKGPKKIIEILSDLPLSEHDPYSFTVDLIYYTEKCCIFVLTGVFREPAETLSDTERYLGFLRTFVLHGEPNGRYVIVNEEMHVNNATTLQQNSSFKHTRLPGNISILNRLEPRDDKEKNELIKAMSSISTMNMQWSKKCLEDSNYNLKNAITMFVELFKNEKIPAEAFRIDEDANLQTKNTTITTSITATDNSSSDKIASSSSATFEINKEQRTDSHQLRGTETVPALMDLKLPGNDNSLTDDKNDYYSVQTKKILNAKQKGLIKLAKDIAEEMITKFKEDSLGYKQLLQICFENKELGNARNILRRARTNLIRRKYVSVLKQYYGLELHYGSPNYLIGLIEKDKYQMRVLDYAIDYVRALIKCNQQEKAKDFVKSQLKILQADPKTYSLLGDIENSTNVKLH